MSDPAIHIRPFRQDDVQALYEAVDESRHALTRWLPWCHETYSIADSQSWVQSQLEAFPAGTMYSFVICDPAGRILGGCGLNHIDRTDRVANLGYWVRSSAAGRGIATAAIRRLVEWSFASTDLERLEVLVAVDNTASQRAAVKAGAVREGILRKRVSLQGASHDCVVYSFVRGPGGAGTAAPTVGGFAPTS